MNRHLVRRFLGRLGLYASVLLLVSPAVLFFLWMLSLSLKNELSHLDPVLKLGQKLMAIESRRNRGQEFDGDRPRSFTEPPPAPEQSGIEGDRHHRRIEHPVKGGNAGAVAPRLSRRDACSFGKDDDAVPGRQGGFGVAHDRLQGRRSRRAIDTDISQPGQIPAEKWNPE